MRVTTRSLCAAFYGNLDHPLSPIIGMRYAPVCRQSRTRSRPASAILRRSMLPVEPRLRCRQHNHPSWGLPAIKTNRILVPTQGYHFPSGWDERKCISRIRRIVLRGCQFAAPPSYRIFRSVLRSSLPAATSSGTLFSSSVINPTCVPVSYLKIPSDDSLNVLIMLPTRTSWGCMSTANWSVRCAFKWARR